MTKTEDMSLNQLMAYYLEGCKVTNGGCITAEPGSLATVFAETLGGQGYTAQLKARAWGELKSEPAVLMKLPGDRYYALSYKTYKEVCNLLSRDLSDCEVTKGQTLSSGMPGGRVYANVPGKPTISAIAWYEMPPGDLKLFQVDGKQYAISLVAPKTINQTILLERRTGSFKDPDPRREINWHALDLSRGGVEQPSFPDKPDYLLSSHLSKDLGQG